LTVGFPPEETLQGTEFVRWVQASLNRVLSLRLPVTGILGPETRSAVRDFQRSQGLPVTGVVGPDTERALIAALAGRAPAEPARIAPAEPAEPEPSEGELDDLELETGSGRSDPQYVRWIQQSLNRIMGLRLAVDGRIGPQTRSAVRSFQQRRGLAADGIVGPRTERALVAAGAGRPPQPRVRARVRRPAERDGCGVPPRTAQDEFELEVDIEELELGTQNVTVRPRLCFFQNDPRRHDRDHFHCGAEPQARHIGAIASPAVGACRRRVGPTPYNTGAEIITAIEAAGECLGRHAVDDIHIFSHSEPDGVHGRGRKVRQGLYKHGDRRVARKLGGRTVVDIPTAALANNVRFVLHGCRTAEGNDNVARSLYQHLAGSLTNPRVYGHPTRGCAGRNRSWREYSKSHPTGRNLSSLPDIVSDQPFGGRRGCCDGT
jgi:peptidoglycan hydrolase-like protein with peptidoglycan-binding domain